MSLPMHYNLKRYKRFRGLQDLKLLDAYNLESLINYEWDVIPYHRTYGHLQPLDLPECNRMKISIKDKRQVNIDEEIGHSLWTFWKDFKKLFPSYKVLQKQQVLAIYLFLSTLLFRQRVKHKYVISWIFELALSCKCVRKCIVQEDSRKMNFVLNRLLSKQINHSVIERLKSAFDFSKCFWSLHTNQLKVLLQYGLKLKIDLIFISSQLARHFIIRGRKAKRRLSKKYFRQRMPFVLMMFNALTLPEADRIRCLANMRLLWKTIPQSFLTSAEMKKTLHNVSSKGQHPQIERICLEYDQEFSSPVRRPRSLQHYVRCAIRNLLYQSNPLPKAIDSLMISERCRPYLNLNI